MGGIVLGLVFRSSTDFISVLLAIVLIFLEIFMRVVLIMIDNPMVQARLQALYSRFDTSILEHLDDMYIKYEEVAPGLFIAALSDLEQGRRSEEMLEKYAIQYNDESINDCGNVFLAVENVPLITAKALQHHWGYNGIELSTRYVDMKPGSLYNPDNTNEPLGYKQLSTYIDVRDSMLEMANTRWRDQYPPKSIKAWVLDRARGHLPLATLTSLSMYYSIRNLRELLARARGTAIKPTVDAVDAIYSLLHIAFPTITWEHKRAGSFRYMLDRYYPEHVYHKHIPAPHDIVYDDNGVVVIDGWVDYGGARDIYRHRSMYKAPYVIPEVGVAPHQWYIDETMTDIDYAPSRWEERQLAHLVPVYGKMWKELYEYMVKLRTTDAVHPTVSHFMGKEDALKTVPYKRRALDDIVKKGE